MTRILLPALALAACAPPPYEDGFYAAAATVQSDSAGADAALVAVIDAATTELHVALPSGDADAVPQALVRAWDRGVAVELLTDVDEAEKPAIQDVIAAGIPTALADGAMGYFDFAVNADVEWTSDQVRMTDCWAIADRTTVAACTHAGDLGDGPAISLAVRGEEIVEDLLAEHNQLFGGTDATALTAFSNPAKSILEVRWSYGNTDDTRVGLWFGPQERLTKRVIDAVYGARSSVRILTDELANDGLARALQAKAANGFQVEVVVGPRFGLTSSVQARVLETEAPDVALYQRRDVDQLPTVVLIDFEETRLGQRSQAAAYVLTHDLVSSARVWKGAEIPSDQIYDGALWALMDTDEPSDDMLSLLDLFTAQRDLAEDL
jgi:hypothetical protein